MLLIPAFLGVLGGLTIPLLDIKLDPLTTPYDIVPLLVLLWMILGVVVYFVLARAGRPSALGDGMTEGWRRHDARARTAAPRQSKIDSGQWAVTTKFGMSTISLIRRSTATLHSM